jgi:glucosamine-6-phosphate deaminase
MDILVKNSAPEAAETLAEIIAGQIRTKANATIGFATGRTMDAVYHNLVELNKKNELDCSLVNAFAIDEYIGLPQKDPQSYASYLDLHVFDRLNFDKKNIYIPDVHSADLDQACYQYEDDIRKCGGFDLVILGIGLNGHIGLNEPGSAIDSRTRIVGLSCATRNSNKVLFKDRTVPQTAITLGIGTILESTHCVMLATGETKSEIIQRFVNGDIHSKVPATALKQHKNFKLILDQHASKLI